MQIYLILTFLKKFFLPNFDSAQRYIPYSCPISAKTHSFSSSPYVYPWGTNKINLRHSSTLHAPPVRHAHQCSLHGKYRCTLPLCRRTRLRSGRGWSNTGWSPSRSNHPWSRLGSGSVGLRWGGWGGTRWRTRRWRGQSCWSVALRCTSCSSCTAHADTHCRRMGEPDVMEEEREKTLVVNVKTSGATFNFLVYYKVVKSIIFCFNLNNN